MATIRRPIKDQVIVLTGASSGIGLATARLAAERGARLVLIARGSSTLEALKDRIFDEGGEAYVIAADVADRVGGHTLEAAP